SGTRSSSTDLDGGQHSRRAPTNHDHPNSYQVHQSRNIFKRISKEPRWDPADL
ncbi:hypothetical protein PanWU01x14_094570, partial [Parasponia andersonii]